MSTGQTGHKPRGCPAKILYVYSIFPQILAGGQGADSGRPASSYTYSALGCVASTGFFIFGGIFRWPILPEGQRHIWPGTFASPLDFFFTNFSPVDFFRKQKAHKLLENRQDTSRVSLDTRPDKQGSTGRCSRDFLLFATEKLTFLPGHQPVAPGTHGRPKGFQKFYVIFSYVPFLSSIFKWPILPEGQRHTN